MPKSIRPWVLVLIVAGILAVPGVSAPARLTAAAVASPTGALPTSAALPSTALPAPHTGAAAPHVVQPLDPTDNYTCFKIDTQICVSAQNNSPNVVPSSGNLTSPVIPLANTTISFYVKSQFALTWPISQTTPTSCLNNLTPIRINVTGTLWNGDPYMSYTDGSFWNENPNTACFVGPYNGVTNKSYPYWYGLSIRSNASGVPNFFPGESVNWWVYIVIKGANGQYTRVTSPIFHYHYAGAWAYSPYPGAVQYGGPEAATADLTVSQDPLQPNWNDSVHVTIRTTSADQLNLATLGQAWVDVSATLPNGNLLGNGTYNFPLSVDSSVWVGPTHATATIPRSFTQTPGTVVQYWVTAYDANNPNKYSRDMIVTPVYSFTVGANGTFLSGIFADDVAVTTDPSSIALGLLPGPQLVPGTNVTVNLTSRNPGTSLLTGEVSYTFEMPAIHERTTGIAIFYRLNSTNLQVRMPSLPLGGYINFTLLVWDYQNTLEESTEYGYSIQPFNTVVPRVGQNLGFLWVYVYDNGTKTWAQDAQVSITGGAQFVNVQTATVFGVAYPNLTGEPFAPFLLPANSTYNITISDSKFLPSGSVVPPQISILLTLHNPMTQVETLRQTDSYTVVLSGDQLFFWLNTTSPAVTYSPGPAVDLSLVVPIIGLIAAVGAVLPMIWWYREIVQRRKEQEKRVTL
jgi:hypothetical protein